MERREGAPSTLAGVMRRYVDRVLRSTYTMMPGRVLSFDATTGRAVVQPLLKLPVGDTLLADGATDADMSTDLPALTDVPVMFPRAKHVAIYFRIDEGSLGALFFSMWSLDRFLAGDGQAPLDPQHVRNHDLSDAVFYPGLYPFGDPIPGFDDADLRLVNSTPGNETTVYLGGDTGDIVILPKRHLKVGDKDATESGVLGDALQGELQALLQSMIDNAAQFVSTGVGPGALDPAILTALNTFIANLPTWLSIYMRLA